MADDLIASYIFFIVFVSFGLGIMVNGFGYIISSESTFFIAVICIGLICTILARLIVNLKEEINKVSFRKNI